MNRKPKKSGRPAFMDKKKSIPNTLSNKKKINPFELHINTTKFNVLGQKNKNDRGMPGVSRSKATKIRENTLLEEYKNRHKNNQFKDRRIGENNPSMDPEKKIVLRMAKEMRRQLSKKNLYNLNDDDESKMQTVTEEEFSVNNDYNFSDDDNDEFEDQQLDYKFVKAQHFGAGGEFLSKPSDEDEDKTKNKEQQRTVKTKKERIEEIIAESKMAKETKRKEKEEVTEAVTKLDEDVLKFQSLMITQRITDDVKHEYKSKNEYQDFDKLLRELAFDRSKKARASNRLKTPEELAKEESQKLKALESARISRMNGEDPQEKVKKNGCSADDLNDGFVLKNEENMYVSYKDGKLLTEENSTKNKSIQMEVDGEGVDDCESGGEDDSEDDDDDDDDESDQYSDILDDDDDDEDLDDEDDIDGDDNDDGKSIVKIVDEEKRKELIDEAKKEIPYTFEVPQQYDSFFALLETRSPEDVSTVLERMIASNHPSLGNNNTVKCQDLFKYILQTIHLMSYDDADSFKAGVEPLQYLDVFIGHLHDLTRLSASTAADSFVSVIEEKYHEYNGKKVMKYPKVDTFIFLKISGMLFPSSDYQHVVMTPVLTFITQLMGRAKLNSARDFLAALFSAGLFYEYTFASKRFAPELVNLLRQIIFLCIPGNDKTKLPHTGSPFKLVGPLSRLLVLQNPVKNFTAVKLTLKSLNYEQELTEDFKITILKEALELVKKVCNLWCDLASFHPLMSPVRILLSHLVLNDYPEIITTLVQEINSGIEQISPRISYLTKTLSKPKSLKMFDPTFGKVIEGMKARSGSKDFQEKQKLMHKLKQERKGAVKALKQDAAFLAKHKLKETLASDQQRKRKVNKLLSELCYQENDYKKSKRRKF